MEDGQEEEEDGQAPGLSECSQEGAASEPLGCQKLDPSIKLKKGYSNFKLNVNVNVVVIVVVIDVTVVAVIVIDVLAKIMLTLTTMCIVAAGSATARRNIDAGLKSLRKAGADPASDHCCIDIGAGKKFAVVSVGRVLTLTASRCSARAWWLTKASSSVQNES